MIRGRYVLCTVHFKLLPVHCHSPHAVLCCVCCVVLCRAVLCSTHVEILGNEPMLMDLLHVAAGKGSSINERFLSAVQDIAAKIPWDELD